MQLFENAEKSIIIVLLQVKYLFTRLHQKLNITVRKNKFISIKETLMYLIF